MYLLTIKDGLGTRHIGPYPSPKHASEMDMVRYDGFQDHP